MIHFVGLGPGSMEQVPPRNIALLLSGLPVLVRTRRHPTFETSPLADLDFTALDDEYENNPTFADTYAAIVARVLRAQAGRGEVAYAVPGHPLVGETTVARLLAQTREAGIPTRVWGAPSFVDACLEAVGEAVTGDLHVVDALSLSPGGPAPDPALAGYGPLLLYQVHSREAASVAKLSLMRAGYPDDFAVTLIIAAGVPGRERVEVTPLYALDRAPTHDHLTSVWVPPLLPDLRPPSFDDLVRVMARLRDPDTGCPWDLKQTHATLRRYVIEEAYEVVEAIDSLDTPPASPDAPDPADTLCDELGDLLLQVVFHAQLAAEEGLFDAREVCGVIARKLVRRHPHIFGDVKVDGAAEVLANWNAIKATEKSSAGRVSVLDGIPVGLPALMRAMETSKRAVKAGFEWPEIGGVLDKVEEEIAELRAEVEANAPADRIAGELGDLLFTLVNVARRLEIDPEEALRAQLQRFGSRFRYIEAQATGAGRGISDLTLAEMESHWADAKRIEKARNAAGS